MTIPTRRVALAETTADEDQRRAQMEEAAAAADRRARQDWRAWSACRGADPELFFPLPGQDVTAVIEHYCRRCPVRDDCLAYGRAAGHVGIWGGVQDPAWTVTP